MLCRFSKEVQEEEGDGLSILSGSSDSTSGSALPTSSNSSDIEHSKEDNFTDILKTIKLDHACREAGLGLQGSLNKETEGNSSKTSKKYVKSKDAN